MKTMTLLDIAPISDDWYVRHAPKVRDTIDTVAAPVQQFSDTVNNPSGDTPTTIWTIVVALLSLAVCILMVYTYRKKQLAKA
ncbi:MAG: hypothetical protein K6D37_07970 [Prevotella sp.]|nr:hypothetical protein [Prevotella sp.]